MRAWLELMKAAGGSTLLLLQPRRPLLEDQRNATVRKSQKVAQGFEKLLRESQSKSNTPLSSKGAQSDSHDPTIRTLSSTATTASKSKPRARRSIHNAGQRWWPLGPPKTPALRPAHGTRFQGDRANFHYILHFYTFSDGLFVLFPRPPSNPKYGASSHPCPRS